MGFWIQYRSLLYKNWILWKRNLLGSLIELFLPIFAILCFGVIRQITKPEHKDAQTYSDQLKESYNVNPGRARGKFPFNKCFIDKTSTLGYSIISKDKDFIKKMREGINSLTDGILGKNKYISFESISDFEDYITGSDYEDNEKLKLCFGVYLNQVSRSNYELMIRYNVTETIYRDNSKAGRFIEIFNFISNADYNDLIVYPTKHLDDFYDYGFLSLMNLADNYFLQKKNRKGHIAAKFYPMRFDGYIFYEFISAIDSRLINFIIFPFLIPISRFLSAIVSDKENRTKELMMMMGLSSSAYWLSWITYYFMIYTVISIVLTILVAEMGIFAFSNRGLIFLYFWLYSMSCLVFSILMSVFFSKAKNAISVSLPVFLFTLFISFGVSDPLTSMKTKTYASLFPCVALYQGTNIINKLEKSLKGIQFDNADLEVGNFKHSLYFTMITIDIIYMILLALYFEAVWPNEWGIKRPWYFLCTKHFWCPRKKKIEEDFNSKREIQLEDSVEQVDDILEAQKITGKAMIVRGLEKKFSNTIAVDGLNLDIYEGQIFALLGHNGAGKTTTISMLTGLLPPTSGDMTVNGYLLSRNLEEIRKNLGICPQQNVIFPDLTPIEHMSLFCNLKGMND